MGERRQHILDFTRHGSVIHSLLFALRSGRQHQQPRGCQREKNGERPVDCVHTCMCTAAFTTAQYASACVHN